MVGGNSGGRARHPVAVEAIIVDQDRVEEGVSRLGDGDVFAGDRSPGLFHSVRMPRSGPFEQFSRPVHYSLFTSLLGTGYGCV